VVPLPQDGAITTKPAYGQHAAQAGSRWRLPRTRPPGRWWWGALRA